MGIKNTILKNLSKDFGLRKIVERILFFSKDERDLFERLRKANERNYRLWYLPHLVLPLVTISLAALIYYLLHIEDGQFKSLSLLNLIINGSLPLVCIHQTSSVAAYLSDFDSSNKNKESKQVIRDLKPKLFYYMILVLLISVVIFVLQVINNPFQNYLSFSIHFSISLFLILISTVINKRVFLLQGKYVQSLSDNIEEGRDSKVNTLRNKFPGK